MVSFKHTAVILGLFSVAGCSMFGSSPTPAPAPVVSQVTPASAAMRDSSMSQSQIRDVQSKLAQDGLYNGAIDGVWGPATSAALGHYQTAHKLESTGRLNADTMSSMDSANTPAPGQNTPTNEVR
jgi:peptidoglycan hydrolase-like protein with peptidoglycan-binding domain